MPRKPSRKKRVPSHKRSRSSKRLKSGRSRPAASRQGSKRGHKSTARSKSTRSNRRQHIVRKPRRSPIGRVRQRRPAPRVRVPTARGIVASAVRRAQSRRELSRYLNAVATFLRKGITTDLAQFQGRSIGGHPLITDPAALRELGDAGALRLEDMYVATGSSS